MNFLQEHIDAYNNAVRNCNTTDIELAKMNLVLDASNALEIVANYLALAEQNICLDYGTTTLPSGTILYRIRKYNNSTDFTNPSEWKSPPGHPLNRANNPGEEALYLASDEIVCLCEKHIMPGDKYVLGRYECTSDIELSGFIYGNQQIAYYDEVGAILNAMLIAPARQTDWNDDLFSILDAYYGKVTLDDLCNWDELMEDFAYELPYKFGVLNQRDELYRLTNLICDILKRNTPEGIKYSSCYLPLDTVNIDCNMFNCVLYHEGIRKVRFLDSIVKTHRQSVNYLECCRTLLTTHNPSKL